MKKLKLCLFGIILGLHSIWAQDSINTDLDESTADEFFEPSETKDVSAQVETIKLPTPTKEERTEIAFEQKKFNSEFKENYKGEKFNYDRIVKPPKEPFIPKINIPAGLLKFLMYTILILMILFIVYQIIKNTGGFNFGKARNKIKVSVSADQLIEDQENIENNDFPKLIDTAKNNQDYRRAVRYYYLWILQKLTELNHIDWHKEKTNYDYYLELNQKNFQEDFHQSNYLFDYIWYGRFDLNLNEFEKAESIFKKTLNKIK